MLLKQLQMEKNTLHSFIDAIGNGLTIQDLDYNIIFQNKYMIDKFGNHTGEKCYTVYENKSAVCSECPIARCIKDGKARTVERKRNVSPGITQITDNT
jgi:hypothetical protein